MIVTQEGEKNVEEEKVKSTLNVCGYLEWAFRKVELQMSNLIKNQCLDRN